MNQLRSRKFRSMLSLLAGASSGLIALPAVAQVTAAKDDDTQKLEKFVVTGSYIPVAADAIAIPVTTINSDDIARTAVTTNALEVLRKAVPQFQGNANIGSSNANIGSGSTGGGSQASLRNLTTLTLINGRRAAASPITGTGGNQFVDLNIIPLAAIDSIEVLLDGASATYGSDATSGVINIKTRRDYNGTSISGFYEWTDNDGKWANRGGNFVIGAGNGKTNITVAGGYTKQDPLYQFERSFSNPTYGTPTYGGVINLGANYFVLNPELTEPPVGATKPAIAFPMATGAVPAAPGGRPYFGAVGSNAVYWGKVSGGNVTGFGSGELAGATTPEAEQVAFNLSNYVTILQARQARGAVVTFDHKFTDNLTFFGDILTSNIKTMSQINAQPVGTTPDFNVTSAHPDNPFGTTLRVRNRFVTNPRVYRYDTNFARIVAGVEGTINETTTFETAVNINRAELAYKNPGVIDSAGLLGAAGISPLATSQGGTAINMFARTIAPSEVAAGNFVGVAFNDFTSDLNSWDGRVVTRAFTLPAGEVTLAIGGEYRREALKGDADLNSIPDAFGSIGWTGATSVNPFTASRDITAGFIETVIPVTGPSQGITGLYTTEIGVAVRHERYSDTDDPTVPKVTLRWLPFNDEFAIRGTFGKSFNAPTLYQVFGPSDVGFSPEVNLLPFGLADVDGNYVSGQSQLRGGSNPLLKPAESDSWTAGVVYSPKGVKGLSVELTYWNIEETDIVGVISSTTILQSVENLGQNSPYVRNLANGQPNPAYAGNPASAVSYDVRIEGFGTDGTLISAPGQVAGNIDSVYMTRPLVNIAEQNASGVDLTFKYKFDLPSTGLFNVMSNFAYWRSYEFDGEELSGRATVTGGTIPRWTNYTTISWERGPFNAFVGARYIPKTDAPDEVSGKTEAEAYANFDVGIGYTFGSGFLASLEGVRVNLAVKNVGNETPPVLGDTFSDANADVGTYDPVGRTFLVSLEYKF